MSENTNKEPLFAEFPAVSKAQWLELIQKDLKGADFHDTLVWDTPEGFAVQPVYTAEDVHETVQFSFATNEWAMRQNYLVFSVEEARQKLEALVKQDFTQAGLVLDNPQLIHHLGELAFLGAEMGVSLFLSAPSHRNELAMAFAQWIRNNPDGSEHIAGIETDWAHLHTDAKLALAELVPKYGGTLFYIDGHLIHQEAGNNTEELSRLLMRFDEMMEEVSGSGVSVADMLPRMKVTLAVGPDYFMEMAKIRAARLLLANILHIYDPQLRHPDQLHIHAVNSFRYHDAEDPDRNLLQSTTEAMSAISAGVQSLSLDTQDHTPERDVAFYERITRNIQLLLKHESHLGKVHDPAGGAYYVETLTHQLAQQAWNAFRTMAS